MAEYVEREASCKDCLHVDVCYRREVINDIEKYIKEYGCNNFKSTADVVEVVRCKDCKHWKEKGFDPVFGLKFGNCNCEHWETNDFYHETDETDYCSYGAKMDGKGEGE